MYDFEMGKIQITPNMRVLKLRISINVWNILWRICLMQELLSHRNLETLTQQ
jgi:hypothetical protein